MSVQSRVQQRRFTDDGQRAVVGLLVAAGHASQRVGAVCRQHRITEDQYNVLRILRGVHPRGHPRCEVAKRLIRPSADVTRLLDRLVRQRLVERGSDPANRRHSIARITGKGLAVLDAIDPEVTRIQRELTAGLSKAQLQAVIRACDLMVP